MMTNLTAAFKALRGLGFFAQQHFKCCRTCAGWAAANSLSELIDRDPTKKDQIKGVVYYHKQDAENKRDGKDFYIAYGSIDTSKHGELGLPTVEVGKIVVTTFATFGVETDWDGNPDTRIKVKVKTIKPYKNTNDNVLGYVV